MAGNIKQVESIEREEDCEKILHAIIDDLSYTLDDFDPKFMKITIQEDGETEELDFECDFHNEGNGYGIRVEPCDSDYDEYYAIIENFTADVQKMVKIYHLVDMESTPEWDKSMRAIYGFLQ